MAYLKFPVFREPTPAHRGLLNIPPPRESDGNHDHYDPNQPRVPAGHPDGGQWTREGRSGAGLFANGIPGNAWPPGAQRDGQYDAEFFSDLVPDNTWTPGAQYTAGGIDNYLQHQKGVEAAKQELLKLGFSVAHQSPVAVDIPGFATPRYYDLIVQDPETGQYIGIEVKTTLYDTIRLNADQVAKDVAVVTSGGTARLFDAKVKGVGYRTYCWGCEKVDLRSSLLRIMLEAARIPHIHNNRPGERLP